MSRKRGSYLSTQQSMVAMAWFENPALYRNPRSIMSDKSWLPLAYMDWLDLAKRNEKMLEAAGHKVVRVPISLGVFRDFCRHRGFDHDSVARSRDTLPQCSTAPQGKKAFLAMESQYDIIPQQPQFDPHFNFFRFAKSHTLASPVRNAGHSTDNDLSRERPWQAVVGPSRP